jgi:hypothetical protein
VVSLKPDVKEPKNVMALAKEFMSREERPDMLSMHSCYRFMFQKLKLC